MMADGAHPSGPYHPLSQFQFQFYYSTNFDLWNSLWNIPAIFQLRFLILIHLAFLILILFNGAPLA